MILSAIFAESGAMALAEHGQISGWRVRSAEALRKRHLRAMGHNKYNIAFSPAASAFLEVPPEFKEDLRKIRDVKVQKAIREVQAGCPANSLREASLRAVRSGAVPRATLDADSRATRSRNKASHVTSQPQSAFAERSLLQAESGAPFADDGVAPRQRVCLASSLRDHAVGGEMAHSDSAQQCVGVQDPSGGVQLCYAVPIHDYLNLCMVWQWWCSGDWCGEPPSSAEALVGDAVQNLLHEINAVDTERDKATQEAMVQLTHTVVEEHARTFDAAVCKVNANVTEACANNVATFNEALVKVSSEISSSLRARCNILEKRLGKREKQADDNADRATKLVIAQAAVTARATKLEAAANELEKN